MHCTDNKNLPINPCTDAPAVSALEQQMKIKPVKTPIKPPPSSAAGSVSSDAPWVVQSDSSYSWGDGNYTLDAKTASTELGCSDNKYCWGMLGIRGQLSAQRYLEKCCTCAEHGGLDSAIHKRTMEAREDVAIMAIVAKHITDNRHGTPYSPRKRVLTPVEAGRGKKQRANTDGDGPTTSFSLCELFAGLCSFALAALIGAWPIQLDTFYEISPAAVGYSQRFFRVTSSGDVRQVSNKHQDIVTVTNNNGLFSLLSCRAPAIQG